MVIREISSFGKFGKSEYYYDYDYEYYYDYDYDNEIGVII